MSPLAGVALSVHVVGVPATQGSMKGFRLGGHVKIVNNNEAKLLPWREAVRSATVATIAVDHGPGWQPITGPVHLRCVFALPRPASAPKRRRTWPIGPRSGDLSKLVRAVEDALTDAGVWLDDAQVCQASLVKDYPGPAVAQTVPGVLITVARLTEPGELTA